MTGTPDQEVPRPASRRFLATAWPAISAADSESRRRRKLAVRAGHAAMAVMVAAAIGGALLVAPQDYSTAAVVVLGVTGVCYILWNLVGTRGIVTLVLWDHGRPPPISARVPRCGAIPYFAVQVALATLVYWTADRGRVPNLVWLALLPPVAYAVFILEWRGIATVSLLMLGVLTASFHRWHGMGFAAYAALAFSFAILFTLVFSLLAVHSERARNHVQRLADELSVANRRLREYAVQAEDLAASRERNRIAREIHDSIGHYLTVANVQLQAARTLWPTDPTQAREAVAKAQTFTQEGLQDIRRSVASLRTSPLDNQSLAEALGDLATRDRSTKRNVTFQLRGQPRELSAPVELSLYRAGQEGLTNASKHSRARHTRVVLDFENPKKVSISVVDDGTGAEENTLGNGFGLLGLRERAQLLGGELRIQTAPNHGFSLTFEVPA